MINALPHARYESSVEVARNRTAGQFEAWDMLRGALHPELGGHPRYLDVIGINFYPHNQWIEGWGATALDLWRLSPVRHLLMENYRRYGRPIYIAETASRQTEGRTGFTMCAGRWLSPRPWVFLSKASASIPS